MITRLRIESSFSIKLNFYQIQLLMFSYLLSKAGARRTWAHHRRTCVLFPARNPWNQSFCGEDVNLRTSADTTCLRKCFTKNENKPYAWFSRSAKIFKNSSTSHYGKYPNAQSHKSVLPPVPPAAATCIFVTAVCTANLHYMLVNKRCVPSRAKRTSQATTF